MPIIVTNCSGNGECPHCYTNTAEYREVMNLWITDFLKASQAANAKKTKTAKKKGKKSVNQLRREIAKSRMAQPPPQANTTNEKNDETVEDVKSVKSNRFHKRFTKTKKPARL